MLFNKQRFIAAIDSPYRNASLSLKSKSGWHSLKQQLFDPDPTIWKQAPLIAFPVNNKKKGRQTSKKTSQETAHPRINRIILTNLNNFLLPKKRTMIKIRIPEPELTPLHNKTGKGETIQIQPDPLNNDAQTSELFRTKTGGIIVFAGITPEMNRWRLTTHS